MSQSLLSLLVLAGIAIFLIVRLRNVLGTRDGFEKPRVDVPQANPTTNTRDRFEVIEGGPDKDIVAHVEDGTSSAKALAAMKLIEPGFSVSEFLSGARGAYEMILMSFEKGDMDAVRPFLSEDVYNAFDSVVEDRKAKGLTIDAEFIGVRELKLLDADFDRDTQEAEIKIRFVGELSSVVRNAEGEIVEGDPNDIKRQKDIWTFARTIGRDDPNWELVATGA